MTFVQRRPFELRELRFEGLGTQYRERSGSRESETFIPFEGISRHAHRRVTTKPAWLRNLGLGLVPASLIVLGYELYLGMWPLFALAATVMAVGAFAGYIATERSYLYIPAGRHGDISLLLDRPNRERFESFLSQLFDARDFYLRGRYCRIDDDALPDAELEKLSWLLDEGVIGHNEFESLKSVILDRSM